MPNLDEQEVTIQFCRTDDTAKVFASDTRYITKLNRLVKEHPETWKCTGEAKMPDGKVFGKFYECPIKMISLRSKKSQGRVLSEEEKAVVAERMRNMRRKKSQG